MSSFQKFKSLTREEMKTVSGGMEWWCRRRSTNVEDQRPGIPHSDPNDPGYINANGCWVYSDMPSNAHPDCDPDKPLFTTMGTWGVPC